MERELNALALCALFASIPIPAPDSRSFVADGLWDCVGAAVAANPTPYTESRPYLPTGLLRGIRRFSEASQTYEPYGMRTHEDVNAVKWWFAHLKNAPRLDECERLPSLDAIKEARQFASEYGCWLQNSRGLTESWAYQQRQEYLTEGARAYEAALLAMELARNPFSGCATRREALAELRGLIGNAAYYAARWPMTLPPEHFVTGK